MKHFNWTGDGKGFEDHRKIHVREFENNYRTHWDIVTSSVDVLGHLRHDYSAL